MLHARRPGGPVAAAQNCATHGPLSVATRGRRCTGALCAVRLAVVDEGLSHHEAGRRFGIDRRTVKKMLSYSAPPGYRRTKPVRRPKLDGFTGIVDAILEADTDPDVPRKQRPGGPVAAAQNCATHGPLSVATRGRRCTAWSSMRRFDWRLLTRV